jgi:hypothetical protein
VSAIDLAHARAEENETLFHLSSFHTFQMLLLVVKYLPNVLSANAIQITTSLSICVLATASSQNANCLYAQTPYSFKNDSALSSTVSQLANFTSEISIVLAYLSFRYLIL